MRDLTRGLAAGLLLGAAALVLASLRRRDDGVLFIADEYPAITEDIYLTSKFPWFGADWSSYCPVDVLDIEDEDA